MKVTGDLVKAAGVMLALVTTGAKERLDEAGVEVSVNDPQFEGDLREGVEDQILVFLAAYLLTTRSPEAGMTQLANMVQTAVGLALDTEFSASVHGLIKRQIPDDWEAAQSAEAQKETESPETEEPPSDPVTGVDGDAKESDDPNPYSANPSMHPGN